MTDLHTTLTQAAAALQRFAAAHGHLANATEFAALNAADTAELALAMADRIPVGGNGTYADIWLPALPGEDADAVDVQFNTHLSAFITSREALRQSLGQPLPLWRMPPVKPERPLNSGLLRRLRLIAAHHRAPASDRALATILAGIAGAANAGGFILLGSYTSHMTGYLSQVADNLVLGQLALVAQSMAAIGCFVLGAAGSAFAINWARQFWPRRQYSLPIGIQGGLFLLLAAIGAAPFGAATAQRLGLLLLCVIMGFQNATITKISQARIRTTHATGMITDVGIELGRAAYGRSVNGRIAADRAKLWVLLQLLATFLVGGIVGALGYGGIGFGFSLPLAGLLLALAWV